MISILKMEFRRLLKCGYFYAFPATAAILLIIEKLTSKGTASDEEASIFRAFDTAHEMMIFAIFFTGMLVLHLWSQEYKKGFIKNIAGNVSGKHIITLSRLIVGSFVMIVNSIVSFLFGLFFTMINFPGIYIVAHNPYPPTQEEYPELLRDRWISSEQWNSQQREYLFDHISEYFLKILAGIAIIAFVIMLYEIIRSDALGFTMVLLISFEFLENIICNIVGLITDKFDIGQHLILTQFRYINYKPVMDAVGEWTSGDPDPMWTFWLRTALYVIVFTIAAVVVSRKKDTI